MKLSKGNRKMPLMSKLKELNFCMANLAEKFCFYLENTKKKVFKKEQESPSKGLKIYETIKTINKNLQYN